MKTEYAARHRVATARTGGPGDETNGKYGKQLHRVRGDEIVVTVHFTRAPPLPTRMNARAYRMTAAPAGLHQEIHEACLVCSRETTTFYPLK